MFGYGSDGELTTDEIEAALGKLAAAGGLLGACALTPAIAAEQRFWFNPQLTSRNFLVPGSIAIVMTLVGTLLTSLVVAREWERGTMEAMMATPVSAAELLAGAAKGPRPVLGTRTGSAVVDRRRPLGRALLDPHGQQQVET